MDEKDKAKRIVFESSTHKHAQLKVRLQYDSLTQAEFFRSLIEGYLNRRHDDKVSLNPRSTKLIAVFSPWDTEIHLPFTLGAEDSLAMRLPPHQLGAPTRWFRQLSNIDGSTMSKTAIRSKIDSGDWPTQPSKEILDMCCEVAQYNSQVSWQCSSPYIGIHDIGVPIYRESAI